MQTRRGKRAHIHSNIPFFSMDKLPVEVIRIVVTLLDTKSILAFSSCSRYLHDSVYLECNSVCIYMDNNNHYNFHSNSSSLSLSAQKWYLFVNYVKRHHFCLSNTHTVVIIHKESILSSQISQSTPPSSAKETTAFSTLKASVKQVAAVYLPNLRDTLYIH